MRTLISTLGFGVASLAFASSALALDWSRADALFNQRATGRPAVADARQAYTSLLQQAQTKADKLRAATQLGRLAIYEGEMLLPKTARDERRSIFSQCWCADPRTSGLPPRGTCATPGFIDQISPSRLGEAHPSYYFFHGACLSYWSEQGSLSERLAFSATIKTDIETGLGTDTRFEGGGIQRLKAGVQSNPATKALGFFNPTAALAAVDEATASAPFPGDPLVGAEYYENWSMKASVLIQLHAEEPTGDWRNQALALLEAKIAEMDEKVADGALPVGHEPEFRHAHSVMKEQYRTLRATEE